MTKIVIGFLLGVITFGAALYFVQHMEVPEASKRVIVKSLAATEA